MTQNGQLVLSIRVEFLEDEEHISITGMKLNKVVKVNCVIRLVEGKTPLLVERIFQKKTEKHKPFWWRNDVKNVFYTTLRVIIS